MNKEQKKFKKVIKARLRHKSKVRIEENKKLAIIKKLKEIKDENTQTKK